MESRDLTLALVQADLAWEHVDDNLARMDRHLAGVRGARVVVLPEMFTTGFSMNAPGVAETMEGKGVSWLRETARRSSRLPTSSCLSWAAACPICI